jgi:hypothetical protein
VSGQPLEGTFVDDQIQLIFGVWRECANQKSVVINKAVSLDDDLDHVMVDLAPAFDLNRDVPTIGESVQDPVDATIQ